MCMLLLFSSMIEIFMMFDRQSVVFISRSFLPCSEKICMAVTEMAALFPKVRWLPPAVWCPSPEQLRDLLLVWKQLTGIKADLLILVRTSSLHYMALCLPLIGLLCFMFTHTRIQPTDHNEGYLWVLSCQPLIKASSSLLSLTEAVLRDCARVPVSAHF